MKNVIKLVAIVGAVALLASCASPMASGALYTNTTTGLTATTNNQTMKMGQACTNSLFGLFAWGNGSIAMAKANGHVMNVSTVDYTAHNVLGIYGTYCTVVKGS